MIKKIDGVLSDNLIKNIIEYFKLKLKKQEWKSSLEWDQILVPSSANILTHEITCNILIKQIKENVERALKVDFDKENLRFIPMIYIWSGGSYITWHSDNNYPYSGTIYLNEEWDSNDGGIFLYKENETNEIRGIEPKYNMMVVNYKTETSEQNFHCVTCIVPGTLKKRITIQWRTVPKEKKSFSYQ